MNLFRSNKFWTLMVSFALAFTYTQAQTNHNHDNHSSDGENHIHSTDVSKEKAQKILTAYLEIKDALVQTDGESASIAASNLIQVIKDSNDELVGKIREDVSHIAGTTDPGQQREYFKTLSENVYMAVKATEANEAPIYPQYCPMALKNTGGFWLSAEKEVNNPYFGDRMLHCGMVKETLD